MQVSVETNRRMSASSSRIRFARFQASRWWPSQPPVFRFEAAAPTGRSPGPRRGRSNELPQAPGAGHVRGTDRRRPPGERGGRRARKLRSATGPTVWCRHVPWPPPSAGPDALRTGRAKPEPGSRRRPGRRGRSRPGSRAAGRCRRSPRGPAVPADQEGDHGGGRDVQPERLRLAPAAGLIGVDHRVGRQQRNRPDDGRSRRFRLFVHKVGNKNPVDTGAPSTSLSNSATARLYRRSFRFRTDERPRL